MQFHTFTDHFLVKPSLSPKSRGGGAANGTGVDCLGFTRAALLVSLGTHDRDDADETLTVKLQESADDGSTDPYADVTSGTTATIGNVVPDATTGTVYAINVNLKIRKRYLRAVYTPGGTTPTDLVGALFILGNDRQAPPAQDRTPVSV